MSSASATILAASIDRLAEAISGLASAGACKHGAACSPASEQASAGQVSLPLAKKTSKLDADLPPGSPQRERYDKLMGGLPFIADKKMFGAVAFAVKLICGDTSLEQAAELAAKWSGKPAAQVREQVEFAQFKAGE